MLLRPLGVGVADSGEAMDNCGQFPAAIRENMPHVSEAAIAAGRLLQLLALLQARRDWPGGELRERLGVSARTVRRDVERLRDLGYPIESVSGPAGGYRLQAGAAMPPLLLDDGEAIAIAIALRTATRSAVAGIEETALRALLKLEQVLPAPLRRRVQALGGATSTPASPVSGPQVDAQLLLLLAVTCRDRERVRFGYRGREGAATRRAVEPHAVVALGRRWYLVAWDPGRGAWRTFRVDRIEGARTDGQRFALRTIPGGDAATFVRSGISAMRYRYEATVTYEAPLEQVRARAPAGWGPLEPLGEQRCVYRTGDDDVDWLALRIAMAGVDFSVEGPPELSAALERLARRFTTAAAGSAPARRRSE